MCKLNINLDNYKEFFVGEHGLALFEQIIQNDDTDAIQELIEWKDCPAKVLNKIAVKFMTVDDRVEFNLGILEEIAENPKVSAKTLEEMCDFATNLICRYRKHAEEVLDEIAESKKINEDIVRKLYKVAAEYSLHSVMGELAENSKTPDEILFSIMDIYDEGEKQYRKVCKQIVERYKKLKQQIAERGKS